MLQDSIGGGRNSAYYAQGFGTPGNIGAPLNGMQAAQAEPGRTRPRARSNIGMQDNQNPATGISQWQTNVQASQASPPTIVDQRSHGGYVNPNVQQQSQYVPADVPLDPGSRPTVKGLGLSKQEKKAILDDWQKKSDRFEQYKASQQREGRQRSKSQSRYNDGQYAPPPGGTLAFPTQSGYGSQPSSDIERAMSKLTLSGLKPQGNDAAAQRQAERGRRLSGGALGLSGSAAQQAQQLYEQQEQQRMIRERERSRSRQPYDRDETVGGIRPAYMPAGRGGNITNVDPGLTNPGQPAVYPGPASQYVNAGARQEMSRGGGGQYVAPQGAGQYVSPQGTGTGQYISPQGTVPANVPYAYQAVPGQQPQVSPALFAQQLPPQAAAQFAPSQFVPMTTVGGIQTMGIPIGNVSQFPGFAGQPGVSPMMQPMDVNGMAPYLTPAFVNQPMPPPEPQPPQQPRRKTNIADVINPQQQQQQYQQQYGNPNYINPKTILTPAPPPKQHITSNISNINGGSQPAVQTRPRAISQSGYVTATASNSQPSSQNNRHSAYINPTGAGVETNPTAYPMRPGMSHGDTLETTGPQGFGSRPRHTREPSYKANIKPQPQSHRTESETSSRSGVPVVSMRGPNPDIHPQHFSPKVITYDLNGEHRQDVPLRFGRFIYERDCTHGEWNLFTQQILETWAARNPAYNYYHSAVKRVDAILSAWNFAFFHPRGMDVVLFKGNERRSGPRFGEPEPGIDFQTEASPVSEDGDESSTDDSDDDDENPAHYLASMNPQYRAQIEREKAAKRAHRAEEKRREAAARPLEAPHSLVIYEITNPNVQERESYR